MAKFLPGPTVAEVRGSIGGTTYSRNRYGAYMRYRAKPVVSTTEKAIAAKARMTAATQAWQGLSAALQASWNMWADSNPVTGALGESQQLTGHAAWVGNWCLLSLVGQTPLTNPPVTPAPRPLTSCSVEPNKTLSTCDVPFAFSPVGGGDMIVARGCYVASAGKHWIENLYRLVAASALGVATPWDIFASVEAQIGTMVIGHRLILSVAVLGTTTGLLSAPLRCEAVIV